MKKILQKIKWRLKRVCCRKVHQPKPEPVQDNNLLQLPKDKLTYKHDNLYTFNNADFLNEAHFISSYNAGKNTDLGMFKTVDFQWRVHVLCWAASTVLHIKGDFVECGVNTGMFSKSILEYTHFNTTIKRFYLLDTYNGLDAKYSTEKEMQYDANMGYKTQTNLYDHVLNQFAMYPNVKIIKGSVPETLQQIDTQEIAFVSIDMNSVLPEVEALEFLWNRIVYGGMIVLDDYGYPGHENQKKAHDEFANRKNVKILSLPTCQGLILKL